MLGKLLKFWKLLKDEGGTALSEYLFLLSVLCGGTLLAVTLTAAHLSGAYGSWSTFYSNIGYITTGSGTSAGGTPGNQGNGNGGGSSNAHGGNPNANGNAGGNGHGNH